MKKSFWVVVALLVLVLSMLFIGVISVEDGELYTDNIADYDSKKYPVPSGIFPQEIPENCEVVKFYYFDYWHEAEDVYLELKFSTKEEMDKYISYLKTEYMKTDNNFDHTNTNPFVEEKNIYNSSYIDCFCEEYNVIQGDDEYFGYSFYPVDSEMVYECNFSLISYSYQDMIVISSTSRGYFRDNVHEYTPKYFERFNVPLDTVCKRLFYKR